MSEFVEEMTILILNSYRGDIESLIALAGVFVSLLFVLVSLPVLCYSLLKAIRRRRSYKKTEMMTEQGYCLRYVKLLEEAVKICTVFPAKSKAKIPDMVFYCKKECLGFSKNRKEYDEERWISF